MSGERAVATLAGGCFWCVEAVFELLVGVRSVTSGYTGGHLEDPSYQDVSTGTTGHAEAVRRESDPTRVGYREVLDTVFSIHDPTTLHRQRHDVAPRDPA